MKIKTKQIPRCETNPVVGIIADSIHHYDLLQSTVAKAMGISPGLLSDVMNGKKGISAEFALRFERCLGVSAEWLLRTQAFYDYCTAHHNKSEIIEKEVEMLKHTV